MCENKVDVINGIISINDLLSIDIFKDCYYVGNTKTYNNLVKSITVMDVKDIFNWLHCGDVVLISRFMQTELSEEFIDNLGKKKIACIISKKMFIECISADIKSRLDKYSIPVILLNDLLSFSEVILAIQNKIIDIQTKNIVENQEFQISTINYLSQNDLTKSLCDTVHDLTGINIAIADNNYQIIDYSKTNSINIDFIDSTIIDTKNPIIIKNMSNNKKRHCYIVKDSKNKPYIMIPDSYSNINDKFYTIIEYKNQLPSQTISQIEIIEAVFFMRRKILNQFEKSNMYYRSMIFYDLLNLQLNDNFSRETIGYSLKQSIGDFYYILSISFNSIDFTKNIQNFKLFNDLLDSKNLSFNNIIFLYNNYWIIMVNRNVDSITEYANLINISLKNLFKANHSIGVSELHTCWTLNEAYEESIFSLNYIHNNHLKNNIYFYKSFSILQILLDKDANINSLYLEELYNSYIKPILIYDKTKQTNLYETLSTFFSNNLSYKNTSEALFIHVNTLRARIKNIENLTTVDFNNINSIINIKMAQLAFETGAMNDFLYNPKNDF